MFKFIIGGRRRPGMTHREYLRYAQVQHGGKVMAEPNMSLRQYRQNHILDSASGTREHGCPSLPDFDSFSELWFDDAAGMQAAISSEYYQNIIKPDEPEFTDDHRILVMATEEFEIDVKARRNGRLKLMRFLRRAADVSYDAFLQAWVDDTQRLVLNPHLTDRICRVIHSRAISDGGQHVRSDFVRGTHVNVYDGVESIWFDSLDDVDAIDRYRSALEEPGSKLVPLTDRNAELLIVAEEWQIVPVIN